MLVFCTWQLMETCSAKLWCAVFNKDMVTVLLFTRCRKLFVNVYIQCKSVQLCNV